MIKYELARIFDLPVGARFHINGSAEPCGCHWSVHARIRANDGGEAITVKLSHVCNGHHDRLIRDLGRDLELPEFHTVTYDWVVFYNEFMDALSVIEE